MKNPFFTAATVFIGIGLLIVVYLLVSENIPATQQITIISYEDCVAAGYPVMESYPSRCQVSSGETFVQNVGNEVDLRDEIVVDSPRPLQGVFNPLYVTGRARGSWFFEGSFPVEVKDKTGNVIASGIAQARSEWMTESFVPFEAELEIPTGAIGEVVLVLAKDNPSGLPEHGKELQMPLLFSGASSSPKVAEKINVNIFFLNSKKITSNEDECSTVFSVSREIPKTVSVARIALEQLFAGVPENEEALGYSTAINPGVKIQSLHIENGVATVDLSNELEENVAGSCRVRAITTQIEKTLQQFPTVRSVVISVDGNSEEVLQP